MPWLANQPTIQYSLPILRTSLIRGPPVQNTDSTSICYLMRLVPRTATMGAPWVALWPGNAPAESQHDHDAIVYALYDSYF